MIEVVCAIIFNEEKLILATQRSANMPLPLKWEFPGGKIENNESPENAIKREIFEELNIEIGIISSLNPYIYSYPDKEIKLIPFVCQYRKGELQLTEHSDFGWFTTQELENLDWAAADIPIVVWLKNENLQNSTITKQ